MRRDMSKLEVGKGAAYLFIEMMIVGFSGYGFWLIMSKITTVEVIGTSSALVSLAGIFIVLVGIGVTSGVQRFLGKSFSEQKLEDAKMYVKTSLLIVSIGIIAGSTVILIAKDWIYDAVRFDFNLIIISIIFIASYTINFLFRSVIIASIKTKILVVVSILSSIAKFAIAIILVLIGTGALGVTIGITSFSILGLIILAFTIRTIFKLSKDKPKVSFSHSFRNIIIASMASWVPGLINTIGSQLGTIVVFGSQGPSQAGIYFVAFSIVLGISTIMSVLSVIAFPILSAMHDGRKRFTWRIIKMSSLISLPFSSSIFFYSKEVIQLFGQGYSEGSSALEIMLLSMLPTAIMTGISILVYSYGNYRQVLAIGLATSIPRTLLYFILVPVFGGTGAAISYTIGSIIGFIVSIVIAKKVGMQIFWKDLAFIWAIPTTVGFLLSYFGINYIIGVLATLIISYILLIKLLIITRSDIQDSLGILPYNISNPIIKIVNILDKKSNRSY
jgi:O-antigen/teichoic acid export membrane protein